MWVLRFVGSVADGGGDVDVPPLTTVYAHVGFVLLSPYRPSFQVCVEADPLHEGTPHQYIKGTLFCYDDFAFAACFDLRDKTWLCSLYCLVIGNRAASTACPYVVPIRKHSEFRL